MKHIIMQHKVYGLYQEVLLLSTVKIGDIYETALLDEDLEELQMFRTDNINAAINKHLVVCNECFEKTKAARHKLAENWPFWYNIKPFNREEWAEESLIDAGALVNLTEI